MRRTTSTARRPSTALVAFVLGALVAVAIAVVVASGEDDDGSAAPTLQASGAADVALDRFEGDAPPLTLAGLAGQPLVVNFFASWCGPCAREMPAFEDVHQQRGDEVRFIGVNIQDTPAAALDLVARTGVTYDVVRDTDAALFRALGAVSMPTTVLVTAEGEITEVWGGELSAGALQDRIDRLLEAS